MRKFYFLIIFLAISTSLFSQSDTTFKSPDKYYYTGKFDEKRWFTQYRCSPCMLFGWEFGRLSYYHGWFLSFATSCINPGNADPSYNTNTYIYDSWDSSVVFAGDKIERGYISYNFVKRIHQSILLYAGAGYGWKGQYDVYKNYSKDDGIFLYKDHVINNSLSYDGIETSTGVIIDLHIITINAGVSYINLKKDSFIFTFGIGTSPTRKLKKQK